MKRQVLVLVLFASTVTFLPKARAETPLAPPTAPSTLDSDALQTPTRSLEDYEKARQVHLWERSKPDWGIGLNVAPRAFKNADLRAPVVGGPDESKPRLTGLVLSGEKVLAKNVGQLAVGAEFGMFGNTRRNQFSGLLGAVMTLGPYVTYQGTFFPRQIVVPAIKTGYEATRISYSFAGRRIRDLRTMPRIELGLLVYLNFLEPSSAGHMELNYGIKRTYLSAFYSIAPDTDKQQVDLTENGAIRAGFRFEF